MTTPTYRDRIKHLIVVSSEKPVAHPVLNGEVYYVGYTLVYCERCGLTCRMPIVLYNAVRAREDWDEVSEIRRAIVEDATRYLPDCTGTEPTKEYYMGPGMQPFLRAATTDGTWKPI